MERKLDLNAYAKVARQAAAEGCVLLKNDKEALPLKKGDKVAVFGRCALHYYKSGLGSGGLVNTRYVVSILDALKACEDISINRELLSIYEKWSVENPVDEGCGWGTVPWSQAEMPVSQECLQAAADADVALVIIGRTAGEDQDNGNKEGSYLLTEIERDMIAKVSGAFERTVVLLNVGNIMDMKWVEEYNPAAVMYVWQGGQEGGNGVMDVLTGAVNPCGKLTDTIAYHIEDYPSTKNFGDQYKNIYEEDIYVGYRYFETFAKEKVQYPFGFGLSYTQFEIEANIKEVTTDNVRIGVKVTNIGNTAGKEVVQVYIQAPQGVLGKPVKVLAGFAKTGVIESGKWEEVIVDCPKTYFASYDDTGVTGHKSCYVLEAGEYGVYAGNDVRSAVHCGSWSQEFAVLEQLEEACAPAENFKRIKPMEMTDGSIQKCLEAVPLRTVNPFERLKALREEEIVYSGDRGLKLRDVFDGNATLDEFVAQLSDEDLMCLFRGEGMCSPKVTPGTAGAFGGLTENHRKFGIPAICCADGPSGIRMDCGTKAFSLPNGTALGCTFHLDLIKELYVYMGLEMRKNKVDTLLGPGINIHRSPLNGRNFEYISEDPLLTGKMGAVQLMGMHECGVTGTMKHYAANNQEHYRTSVGVVASERALREIYLKGYEICVKEGNAKSVMTTYGPINGNWTAGNFDLCTMILRKQWGFKGIVMTDWWSTANWEEEVAEKTNRAPMVRAQNDIYMCCASTEEENLGDNVKECLDKGMITRYDLQRNVKNILSFILETPAMLREMGLEEELEVQGEEPDEEDMTNIRYYTVDKETGMVEIPAKELESVKGVIHFCLVIPENGDYSVNMTVKSSLSELAQLPVTLYVDNLFKTTCSFRGTEGKEVKRTEMFDGLKGQNHFVKFVMQGNGLEICSLVFQKES